MYSHRLGRALVTLTFPHPEELVALGKSRVGGTLEGWKDFYGTYVAYSQ